MHVSPNIIRFPAPSVMPARQVNDATQQDNLVSFPKANETAHDDIGDTIRSQLQEFGQLFAAHRIGARIADELEAVSEF